MPRILSFIFFFIALVQACAVSLQLDGVGDYTLRHNPQLAAARLRIEEARGRLVGAGRLSNPELGLEVQQNVRTPERSFQMEFMQRFPVTARLRLEKAVSRAELLAAQADVRNGERKLAAEARTLAVRLLALRDQQQLRVRQRATSNELGAFTTKRVEAGEASVVDAAQIQLESAQIDTALLLIESERVTLVAALRPLLGLSPAASVEITGNLSPPSDALPQSTMEWRPDYQAAQHNAHAARESAALARANKWSDIGFGLTAAHARTEDAPEGFSRDIMLGLKLSLPLPLWNANEGRIKETSAAAIRMRKEAETIALQIRSEVEAARGEMDALAKVIAALDQQLIPQAQTIVEQLRAGYAAGQIPLTEIIRARSRQLEIEAQRIEALRDFHLARTRHLAATGAIVLRKTSNPGK